MYIELKVSAVVPPVFDVVRSFTESVPVLLCPFLFLPVASSSLLLSPPVFVIILTAAVDISVSIVLILLPLFKVLPAPLGGR